MRLYPYTFRVRETVLALVLMALAMPVGLWAKGSSIRFAATVESVEQTSDTEAIVTVRLQSFSVPITVNADTEIELAGDEVGIEGLVGGAFVKIAGFFSAEGIVAEEIDILDVKDGQFRLRGEITAAGAVSGGTLITLLGVDVLVNEETAIGQRGTDGAIGPDDLAAGMLADVAGNFDGEQLIATRLKVGSRGSEAIRVEFEGTIVAIDGSFLQVDTDGGGSAAVVITDSTRVKGTLEVGSFVEVRGTLNEALAVVALTIKVDRDGDGDADDDHKDDDDEGKTRKTRRAARLVPATDRALEGEVETEFLETPSGQRTQELELAFHRSGKRERFTVQVTFRSGAVVDFGAVEANGGGRVKVKYRSQGGGKDSNLLSLLPADTTVKDIVRVDVLDEAGTVVLSGVLED